MQLAPRRLGTRTSTHFSAGPHARNFLLLLPSTPGGRSAIMSTLGKRKSREEKKTENEEVVADTLAGEVAATHGSTLFVSNLPYTATSVDLQTLFSDLAPVRSAFVVTEHGTGVSKGVGYVSFAIREDAQHAQNTVLQDGLSLQGRNLRVQWADTKVGLFVCFHDFSYHIDFFFSSRNTRLRKMPKLPRSPIRLQKNPRHHRRRLGRATPTRYGPSSSLASQLGLMLKLCGKKCESTRVQRRLNGPLRMRMGART
jgi:RNA recognition motif-containing protein